MRIFIITDGPVSGTGFGEEMRHIAFRLAQNGHEIIWLSLQHFGSSIWIHDYDFPDVPHKQAKIRIVGNWGNPEDVGSKIFPKHYREYIPDIVMLLGDPHILTKYARLKMDMGFPLIFYMTLDGLPVNLRWLDKLRLANLRITMTNWARKRYADAGVDSVTIHHGINWKWWSTTKEQKMKLRSQYGISEDTVVYISWDVNQHRKRQDALLRCWKAFRPETKNVKLILWTDWWCRLGWDLEPFIKQYDIPRETILSPKDLTGEDKFWEVAEPPEKTREIAMLGDVYVSTTSGEGFGKCNLEAMNLGMPVVATKCSAIPEVVDNAGILIPSYNGQSGRFRWHDNVRGVEGKLVNERFFTEALYRMYVSKEERDRIGLIGKTRAQQFDYDSKIIPKWLSLLGQVNPDMILAKELLGI